MSFSSFKDHKLIFENFRKFVNEGEEEDADIVIPEPTAAPPKRTQAQHSAAAAAAETGRDQQAADLAAKRAARASREQAEMGAAFPEEDPTAFDIPAQQTSPQQRVQQAYISARKSGKADGMSSGIALAMADLKNDPEALDTLTSMVSGDPASGYKFVGKGRPQDQSVPGMPTRRRTRAGDLPPYRK